jgi:hypothetical protein
MTTVTFAQRLYASHFIGSGRPLADLCIIEITPQAAEAVCALAEVWRITVPPAAAGVLPTGIVVSDPDERLGRVRILATDDAPALRDALDRAKRPYVIIGVEGVFLSPKTRCWRIEDAEITIVGTGVDALVRWSGLIEGEEDHITVEFNLALFSQFAYGGQVADR